MKMPLSNSFRSVASTGALAAALLLSACVSQRQHDDEIARSKYYQQRQLEAQAELDKLRESYDKLRRGMALSDVEALTAGVGSDLDARLSELQQKIDGLGRPLRDIERFDVEGGYVVLVQDKILFDSGSADLSAEGRAALGKVAADIEGQPHGRVWVRGHTDSDRVSKPATKEKFPHGNLQLSAARAVEVATALIEQGKVPARDVVVAGFGQHDPIRPNDNSENKRLNRRVEIFVADRTAAASAPKSEPAK